MWLGPKQEIMSKDIDVLYPSQNYSKKESSARTFEPLSEVGDFFLLLCFALNELEIKRIDFVIYFFQKIKLKKNTF